MRLRKSKAMVALLVAVGIGAPVAAGQPADVRGDPIVLMQSLAGELLLPSSPETTISLGPSATAFEGLAGPAVSVTTIDQTSSVDLGLSSGAEQERSAQDDFT